MNKQDLFIRFLLGGTAVSLSYLITVVSPWKILAGIFAAFPAVMLTAVIMVGIASGTKKATNIARGSVYGMMGGIICVITVLVTLQATSNWILSISLGLLTWLTSSVSISTLRERMAIRKTVRHI
ncbi:hypothetical protein QE429_003179 [Bacillus sp. SORGH_AS 510]|uniref:DUF3147 family protein n=1 Tax=Bacillus sp. SORGH_AS_0510 TaxID=3041771 RepID=UPI00278B1F3B|nr:DUF3147 family protein [Bacillus sp. SORGH_AS_0510]MDQ1146352.1 hypothetical protein [Bacillus sp. SORGH_AS_0510]